MNVYTVDVYFILISVMMKCYKTQKFRISRREQNTLSSKYHNLK